MLKPLSQFLILQVFIILSLHSPALSAGQPGQLQVFASLPKDVSFPWPELVIHEGSNNLIRLPFSLAEDSSGKEFIADSEGRIDVRTAKGKIKVKFNSTFFQIAPGFTKKAPLTPVTSGDSDWRVIFNENDVPSSLIFTRIVLEYARLELLNVLPFDPAGWSRSTVRVVLDEEPGCSAMRSGGSIFLSTGSSTCNAAALSSHLIIHEYAHGIFSYISSNQDQAIDEAFADLIAAFLVNSPRIGEGFWKDRQTSWVRDISIRYNFTPRFGNIYDVALTLSSSWWQLRQAVIHQIGNIRGNRLALRVLLGSLGLIGSKPDIEPLSSTAIASLEALQNDGEANFLENFRCIAKNIFFDHGLLGKANDCPILSIRAELNGSITPGQAHVSVEVTNHGRWSNIPLILRLVTEGKVIIEKPITFKRQTNHVATKIAIPIKCGEYQQAKVQLIGPNEELFAESSPVGLIELSPGATFKDLEIDLLKSFSDGERLISDPKTNELGEWLALPFDLMLSGNEQVISASLSTVVDHMLPDDIIIAVGDQRAKIEEFFKGTYEFPIPTNIMIPPSTARKLKKGAILFRDISPQISGKVTNAVLKIKVAKANCSY